MSEYYIQQDGVKTGPFSLEELRRKAILRDTPVWRNDSPTSLPAFQLEELNDLFTNKTPAGLAGQTVERGTPGNGAIKPVKRPGYIWILLGVVAAIAIAMAIYFSKTKGKADDKPTATTVHEREVQKAVEELKAQKRAKYNAEQLKQQIQKKKGEIQSLNSQLRQLRANRAAAIREMDDIRRPHLFRSRRKKEAQLEEQLQIIDRLDSRAATINIKVTVAQASLDSLTALQP